ncbi:MAG TPA: prolyl oligopeptidase family serine peptidase, partial [Chloroflexota bacterium]|nr:prolyl oligopeptidase family serine peptidase [Chloroflexota bacterium]
TLRVVDVATGAGLDDAIPYTRLASLAWLPDNSGFYFTRFPVPGSVPAGQEVYHRHVFLHRLGERWEDDEEVFGAGRAAEDSPRVKISHSGRWLVVEVWQGWTRTELHLLDRSTGQLFAIYTGREAIAKVEFAGDRLFVLTNDGAPNYALFDVDLEHPEFASWRLVIAESRDRVLSDVSAVAGVLVVHELHNATSQLRLYALDGTPRAEAPLPALGTVTGVGGEWAGTRITFGFETFGRAPTAYSLDPATGVIDVYAQGEAASGVDSPRYVVHQQWYPSRDGTLISMFLVHRVDVRPDGNTPTLLTGYGGFNISRTPAFEAALPLWLDAGGVYAVANLRGGGEYGEAWHRAGMLECKQNVFDDFVAAADWLIAHGWTRRERLAIRGGSNGGLLVGAAMTQRPDLFQAVVCQVPLLDMLRFQNLLIARLWVAEYGSSENAEQFRWLYAYSPYHRVRDGERYPATFLLTAEGDGRVDPMHARKMAARLQSANASEAPILLRVDTEAGHGAGKPRSKQLAEATDVWSFLFWQLGVDL